MKKGSRIQGFKESRGRMRASGTGLFLPPRPLKRSDGGDEKPASSSAKRRPGFPLGTFEPTGSRPGGNFGAAERGIPRPLDPSAP